MVYVQSDFYDEIEKLKSQGKYDEALKKVNSILVKDPLNEDALLQITDIEYLKGEIANAEKPVDFLMKYKGKNDAMFFYIKGVLAMEKTQWFQAKDYLKQSLDLLESDNPEIMRCYGLAVYWSGNREKGLEILKKTFEINPLDAEIIYNLIEINLLERKYLIAKKYIKYYKENRLKIQTFGKEIAYYDTKIHLFTMFLETLD